MGVQLSSGVTLTRCWPRGKRSDCTLFFEVDEMDLVPTTPDPFDTWRKASALRSVTEHTGVLPFLNVARLFLRQPVVLLLLDITPMLPVLDGVVMELQDCALPLLRGNGFRGGTP